jgi:stearoyl-CoA desaturase (Delta-9 desaturase)
MSELVVVDPLIESSFTDSTKKRKTVDNPQLRRLQLRHFVIFDILPAAGFVLALALWRTIPPGVIGLGLMTGMYFVTAIGITVGFHRLFTHRTFKASDTMRMVLAALGSMAGQGPVVSWVSLHRRHHDTSDKPGDPHSPNLHGDTPWQRVRGLFHSHFSWMAGHEYPSVAHYAPDILRDKAVMRVNRHYYRWALAGFAVPGLIGGLLAGTWQGVVAGVLWGGAVRMFLAANVIWSINSFLHMFGNRDFQTRENSRNSSALALISVGESWHNNHHAFPTSARFGLGGRQPDIGYWAIRLFERLGLVWDVNQPSKEQIELRREGFRRTSRAEARAGEEARA